jgi:glucosamine kinase
MVIYLGIDGGGSGCRAAVTGRDGAVIGRGAGASANIVTDPDGARASVLDAASAALADAGLAGAEAETVAVLGLAGANVSGAATAFAARLPFARARLVSDALISVRGALGADDGVAAAIGTGSVFAAQRGGAVRFIGGWGFALGDHASGARMGRALLEAALLAHDGLRAGSPLLDEVLAEGGGPEGLVAFGQSARPVDYARYARRIVESGDPVAAEILAIADVDVVTAIDRLMQDGVAPLCFLGGLGPVFAKRLAVRYGPLIREARGTALDGALALARELA